MSENITAFAPIIVNEAGDIIQGGAISPVLVYATIFMLLLGLGMITYGVVKWVRKL